MGHRICRLIILGLCLVSSGACAEPAKTDPESVFVSYQIKAGTDSAFAALLKKTWTTYRQLDLVQPTPHVVLRGETSDGKVYFVEIFTWRDARTPDHAPSEVLATWNELQTFCETRNGKNGIELSEVTFVETADPKVLPTSGT